MRVGAAWVVGAVALLGAATGRAGDVYRWTDAQGVLHIADVPPPEARGVETQTMPEPKARPAAPEAVAAGAEGTLTVAGTPAAAGTPGADKAAKQEGPAKVVITARNEESLGDSKHGVSGTVENTGGETARDVRVAVHVTSPAQGDECIEEDIAVVSSLKPGEKAEFAADFDHPCFRGPTQLDLRAQWQ